MRSLNTLSIASRFFVLPLSLTIIMHCSMHFLIKRCLFLPCLLFAIFSYAFCEITDTENRKSKCHMTAVTLNRQRMRLAKKKLKLRSSRSESNRRLRATCTKTAAHTWQAEAIWTLLLLFWPTVARRRRLDSDLNERSFRSRLSWAKTAAASKWPLPATCALLFWYTWPADADWTLI